jgi:hypothetical protein
MIPYIRLFGFGSESGDRIRLSQNWRNEKKSHGTWLSRLSQLSPNQTKRKSLKYKCGRSRLELDTPS